MAITDSYIFEDFSTEGAYYGPGISYADTLETWRRKFNGMVNKCDDISKTLLLDRLSINENGIFYRGHIEVNGSVSGTVDAASTAIAGYKVEDVENIPNGADLLFANNQITPRRAIPSCFGPFEDLSSTTLSDYGATTSRCRVQEIYIRLTQSSTITVFAEASVLVHDAYVGLVASPSYRKPIRDTDGTIINQNQTTLLHSVYCSQPEAGWDHVSLVGKMILPAGVHEISVRVFDTIEGKTNYNLYNSDGVKNDLGVLGTIYRGDNEGVDAQYMRGDIPVKFTIFANSTVTQVSRP